MVGASGDSTALKVYGEGEWPVRQHRLSKYRTWLKVHLLPDVTTQQLHAIGVRTPDMTDRGPLPEPLAAPPQELEK